MAGASSVAAATITVSSGESIQSKCVNASANGDICNVNSGTYNELISVNKPLTLSCSGTCILPQGISISGNGVVLKGFEVTNREIKLSGSNHSIENNYVHDMTIDSNLNNVNGIEAAISLYSQPESANVVIKNNKITRSLNACIFISGNNHIVEGNDCSYTRQPSGGDADCMRAFGSGHQIRNNRCHDIAFGQPGYNQTSGDYINDAHIDCLQSWDWSSQGGHLKNSLIEGNVCDLPSYYTGCCSAKAFQMESAPSLYACRNNTFRYNILHTNHLSLFYYCQDITFVNNTIVSARPDNHLNFYSGKGVNRFQNNIFYGPTGYPISYNTTESRDSIIGGNNCFSTTNTGWKKFEGDQFGIDPKFINLSSADYHLQPNSTCGQSGAFPLTGVSSPPPSSKPGDANGDGRVDGVDYVVWLAHYGQNISGSSNGDFNNSGKVDGVDYVVWVSNNGK